MTDMPELIWAKAEMEYGAIVIGRFADTVRYLPEGTMYCRADLPPKVRALEWQRDSLPNSAPQRYRAEVPGGMGDYSVTGSERKNEWQWFRNGYFADGHQHHKAMTIEAAKAAAQSDYEARILSALVQP
jgi:hypothetical protein